MGEDSLILQLRGWPNSVDRGGQQDDNAQQDQNALGNIGVNNGIVTAEGNIQEHNDAKTNDRSTVRKPGGDIKKDANGGKLGYQQRDGKGNDKQRSNETGGAAFKAFFQKIRDSEKIEITGAGTEFAPQQPPTKKGSHGDSAGGIDKVETPLQALTDPADQGPGADQAGGIYNSGKEAVDLTTGHIVVSGIFCALLAQNAEREHPDEVNKYDSLYNVIHSAGSFPS